MNGASSFDLIVAEAVKDEGLVLKYKMTDGVTQFRSGHSRKREILQVIDTIENAMDDCFSNSP